MPDPTTYNRLRGLVLSASELKSLSDWPDALVEDYLNIFDNLITLAGLIDIEIDQKLEEVPTDFLEGSIPFVNATTGFLVEDNTNLFWDDALDILNAKDIIVAGLTPSLGVYTDPASQLTSTAPLVGILGHWTRTSPNLSPSNANDNLTLGTGNVTTTGTGFLGAAVFNSSPTESSQEGLVTWNSDELALNVDTGIGPVLQVGQEMYFLIYNDSGGQFDNGVVLRPKGATLIGGQIVPTVEKAKADVFSSCEGTIMMATMNIPASTTGLASGLGRVRGLDLSALTPGADAYLSATTAGGITNTKPVFPNYEIKIGAALSNTGGTADEFIFSLSTDIFSTFNNSWNGVLRESFDFRVTTNSAGTVVTGTLTATGGEDNLTALFSSGFTLVDVTSKTIPLTPGSDTNPATNYVYILESAPTTLVLSTSEWPTTEHIRVAQVFLQTAATTLIEGSLRNQNWNDHVQDNTTNQGHQSHIGQKLRQFEAQWDTGALGSVSIGAGDEVWCKSTAGTIFQMHPQVWPAQDMTQYVIDAVSTGAGTFTISDDGDLTSTFPDDKIISVHDSTDNDGLYTIASTSYSAPDFVITVDETVTDATADGTIGDDIHVVNSDDGAYIERIDLSAETNDAVGGTLLNRSFSIVVWGSANKSGEPAHQFANMPIGSYLRLSPADAIADAEAYSVYTIPKAFQGTGFLIARYTFQVTAGGVWTLAADGTQDLRGFVPNTTAGGGGGGGGGSTTFLGLTDTPVGYTAYDLMVTNAGGTALESGSLVSLVAGTASEITVADDGDGTITIGIADPLIVGKGGSGAATFTDGSILLGSGAGAFTALGVAGNGEIPIGDGAGDPVLATITGTASEIDVTNGAGTITIGLVDPVDVTKGGSGAATFTDHGILLGSGTGAFTVLAEASNGQIPIGSTGADPTLATITQSSANQVVVTNGAGSITLSTPQDIHSGASPTFVGLTLSGLGTDGYVKTATGIISSVAAIPTSDVTGLDTALATFLKHDGSIALTADWDAGSFRITMANCTIDSFGDGFVKSTAAGVLSGGNTAVTSVGAGVGMDFSSITTTGDVIMGTPGEISTITTDQAIGTTHYHSLSAAIKTSLGDADSALQPGEETITGVSNADVITLAIGSQNISATLDNTAVTPATYTNTTLTVDADGRITAASSGAGGGGDVLEGGGDTTDYYTRWTAAGKTIEGRTAAQTKTDLGFPTITPTPTNNYLTYFADATTIKGTANATMNLNGDLYLGGTLDVTGASTGIEGTDIETTGGTEGQVLAVAAGDVTTEWGDPPSSGTAYDQTVTVAQSGADFTTIQAAINSITDSAVDKRYQVFIYPGDYAENVLLNEDYVSLVGFGGLLSAWARIRPVSGVGITISGGICGVYGLQVDMPVTGALGDGTDRCIDVTAGVVGLQGMRVQLTSSTNGVYGSLLRQTSTSVCIIQNTQFVYDMDGTDATVDTHNIFDLQAGNGFDFYNCQVEVNIADQADHVNIIKEAYTSALPTRFNANNIVVTMSHNTYSGQVVIFNETGTNLLKNIFSNLVIANASGAGAITGDCTVYKVNGTTSALVHSSNNRFDITDFDKNYFVNLVASTDSLTSHFDDITAEDETTGAVTIGTNYIFAHSPSDGDLSISGSYLNMYDAVKTIGPRGCDYTGIQEALDGYAVADTLFVVQPDTYVDDTIVFTANNQTVQGNSRKTDAVVITKTLTSPSNLNICECSYTGCKVSRVRFEAATSITTHAVTVSGDCGFDDVENDFTVTGTTNRPDYNYTTTSTGVINIFRGVVTQTNSSGSISDYTFAGCIIPATDGTINVDGTTVSITHTGWVYIIIAVGTFSAGAFVNVNRCNITVDGSACVYTAPFVAVGFAIGVGSNFGSGQQYFGFNNVFVTGRTAGSPAANLGCNTIGLYSGNSAIATPTLTVNSRYSNYVATGGILDYAMEADSTPEVSVINSSFDAFDAPDGANPAGGTLNYISSLEFGGFDVTEVLNLPVLTAPPTNVKNGSVWMENASGLHIYYGGSEYIVAGV